MQDLALGRLHAQALAERQAAFLALAKALAVLGALDQPLGGGAVEVGFHRSSIGSGPPPVAAAGANRLRGEAARS